MQALLRLFHAVPVSDSVPHFPEFQLTKAFLERTLPYGFIFSPQVVTYYTSNDLDELTQTVIDTIGFSAEFANSSFHKSWRKIRDMSLHQLWVEQCMHYLTTYGAERLDLYDEDKIYIPAERLCIPELTDDMPLTVIAGLTLDAIKKKLMRLLTSGIAFSEDTVRDILDVALMSHLSVDDIQSVQNKEIRAALYDLLETVPENPVEFLRYAIFKATGTSLVIKNDSTLQAIRSGEMESIEALFSRYESLYGLERLSSIFNRFKPLFLAFKGTPALKTKINKLRKLAIKYHQPMPADYLNNVTAILKRGDEIHIDQLVKNLEQANTFRKIRLAYALNYRTTDAASIVYKIRNAKGYSAPFTFAQKEMAQTVLQIVINAIVADIRNRVSGLKIHIPSHMHYALPATEKQFIGMIPSGSYVAVPSDMVLGIHWFNQDTNRVDLDLSLIAVNHKYGWDARFRGNGILFSGDMTSAPPPNGASELFYIGSRLPSYSLLTVNYYNYSKDIPVPITLFVGQEKCERLPEGYMLDPNHLFMQAQTIISKQQVILGLAASLGDETRFYVSEFAMGKSISSSHSEMATHARQYLISSAMHPILLDDILTQAGAEIVRTAEGCDLDLSPHALDKTKIIGLLI